MTKSEVKENYTKLVPIVGNAFKTEPLFFPLSEDSEYYWLFANVPQLKFQKSLDDVMLQNNTEWSVCGYLENRASILKHYPQMVTEKRFYHMGIDIFAPCGTKLYAPYDCEVVVNKYEEGEGNYGGVIVLKCEKDESAFYILFGHVNPEKLPPIGTQLKKGDPFAEFGNMSQNGNWVYHTHLQILTQKAFDEGWESKGYCSENDIAILEDYCPNPFLFL